MKRSTLRGRGALVTGASKGLGRALSLELSLRGAEVAMVARGEPALERAADEIARATGRRPATIVADVANKLKTHEILGIASERVGDIDVLMNNASTLGPTPMPLLVDLACEDLADVLETNLVGPFRLTKAVASSMALRQSGTIVFVSSDAAREAYAGWGAYGVSKAAADHLARIMSAELAGQGVRIFSVDPTEMDTDMHAAALPEADRSTLAAPGDIARAIITMLEDASAAPSGSRQIASAGRAA